MHTQQSLTMMSSSQPNMSSASNLMLSTINSECSTSCCDNKHECSIKPNAVDHYQTNDAGWHKTQLSIQYQTDNAGWHKTQLPMHYQLNFQYNIKLIMPDGTRLNFQYNNQSIIPLMLTRDQTTISLTQ
jgi:hypothetical protein